MGICHNRLCHLCTFRVPVYLSTFLVFAGNIPVGPFVSCSGCNPKSILQSGTLQLKITLPVFAVWIALTIHMFLQHKIGKVKIALNSEDVRI